MRVPQASLFLLAALAPRAAMAQQPLRVPPQQPAPPAQDDMVDVEAYGVLRTVGLLCTAFETDAGELHVLNSEGGFQIGERVTVRGKVAGAGVCGSLIVPLLDNSIEAAFAGTGRIVADGVLGTALETDGGERYKLVAPGGFPRGSEVFVRGPVRTLGDPAAQHWIFNDVVGPAFQGFGRLRGGPGSWSLEAEDGATYLLEQPGFAFAQDGDYVFVEGVLSPGDPQAVLFNTSRRAYDVGGVVIDGGGGVPAFQAEGVLFNDVFALEDFGGFQIGQRAFVRGRKLDDYDPLEPRGNLIRSARIDPEFTSCGTLVVDLGGTGVTFRALSGQEFELETAGTFAPGSFVFVSGALDATPASFVHNAIHACNELSGTLLHGFECTPLFFADNGGGYYLLENLGPYWIDDWFCVLGGISACDGGCPAPCMIANIVHDCTQ
jgi:hypothetical protein